MDSITLARKAIGKSFILNDSFKKYSIPETTVNYSQLKEELKRLINIAKTNLTLDGTRPSVFIFGPTGIGKTEIVKSISEESRATESSH
jgi:Cdc6-like AAA superfamily ATPase